MVVKRFLNPWTLEEMKSKIWPEIGIEHVAICKKHFNLGVLILNDNFYKGLWIKKNSVEKVMTCEKPLNNKYLHKDFHVSNEYFY